VIPRAWKHPTGKSPKTVHLVCLGPSHHDYDQAWLTPETPELLASADEIWTLNRGVFNIPHDLLFVLDHIQGEADNFPVYGARLWNHDRHIITSDNCDGWPPHVHKYPFGEIYSWMQRWPKIKWQDPITGVEYETGGPPAHGDWFVNSVSFIVCYAAYVGVKRLNIWGGDYHHHKSGRVEDGHPNVAYWTGSVERATGIQIGGPGSSTFLDSNMRHYIYGFQKDPRPQSVARRAAFKRLAGIDEGEGNGD
jgi:hypothetical protein